MNRFYKIENKLPIIVVSEKNTLEGYIFFSADKEPDELVKALNYQVDLIDKLKELEKFLNDTQFKFGDDYDLKGTDEWIELKAKRQEAREFIRANQ